MSMDLTPLETDCCLWHTAVWAHGMDLQVAKDRLAPRTLHPHGRDQGGW